MLKFIRKFFRDSTFLAEPNESSSKTRARQQSDYFGEDRFGIESGGNMRLMSSNRNRYIDEFDTDPRGEMLTKRRRIYDEDLLYEGNTEWFKRNGYLLIL